MDGATHGQRALGGWLVLVLRQAAITLITFGGIVTLGRLLGPADFALYGYTTIGVTVALAVGDLGLAARIIREGPEQELLRRAFGAQLIAAAAIAVLGAAIIALAPWSGGQRLAAALLLVAILLAALQTLPTAVLEARLAFRTVSLVEVAQRALFTVAAVALAVAGAELEAVPAAAALAGVLAYAGIVRGARWSLRPRFGRQRGLLRGFASDWWQGRLATQLAYAAYPVLGGLLFSGREAGYIVLGLTITSFSVLLAPLVARSTFPAMSGAGAGERWEVFREVFGAFVVLSLPLLAVTAVSTDALVRLLFGDAWQGAVGIVRLTCVATLFGIALTPSLPLLYMLLDSGFVRRVLVGWAVAQWLLTPVAALALGPLAPAAVGAAAGAVALFLLDRRLRREAGLSVSAELARPLAVTAAAMAAGAGVLLAVGGTAGGLAGAGVLLAVYAALAVGLGGIPQPRRMLGAFSSSLRR